VESEDEAKPEQEWEDAGHKLASSPPDADQAAEVGKAIRSSNGHPPAAEPQTCPPTLHKVTDRTARAETKVE
jgi:hypothetical protein